MFSILICSTSKLFALQIFFINRVNQNNEVMLGIFHKLSIKLFSANFTIHIY